MAAFFFAKLGGRDFMTNENKEQAFIDAKVKRILDATSSKSLKELARILNIKPPSVSGAIKRGKIPGDWIEQIATRFNISTDWLLFGEGVKMRLIQGESPENTETNNENTSPTEPLEKVLESTNDQKERQQPLFKASLPESVNLVLKDSSLNFDDYDNDGPLKYLTLDDDTQFNSNFWVFWETYISQNVATRGWVQIEIIKRFPEFIEWYKYMKKQPKEQKDKE